MVSPRHLRGLPALLGGNRTRYLPGDEQYQATTTTCLPRKQLLQEEKRERPQAAYIYGDVGNDRTR